MSSIDFSSSCAGIRGPARPGVLLILGLAGAMALAFPAAHADAYLDALNSAASDVEVDPAGEGDAATSDTASATVTMPGEDMPKGLSREGFEAYLQKSFFGSYAFYQKLDEAGKRSVFEAYGNRANINYVRENIKRQYLNR